jgi:hypothetical protein
MYVLYIHIHTYTHTYIHTYMSWHLLQCFLNLNYLFLDMNLYFQAFRSHLSRQYSARTYKVQIFYQGIPTSEKMEWAG